MPGRGSIRDKILRKILMLERFKDQYFTIVDFAKQKISPWAFYDGAYFRMAKRKDNAEEEQRTKDLLAKISKYHER